jgi:photosystem II stability/assembly factor-like uncharacterized protein
VNLGGGAGSFGYAIYRTINGGRSWALVSMNSLLQPDKNTPSPLPCGSSPLTFVDAHPGWATVNGMAPSPGLYVSQDGGSTWKPQALPRVPGDDLAPMSPVGLVDSPIFMSPTYGVILASPVSSKSGAVADVTGDGGRTWQADAIGQLALAASDFVDQQTG